MQIKQRTVIFLMTIGVFTVMLSSCGPGHSGEKGEVEDQATKKDKTEKEKAQNAKTNNESNTGENKTDSPGGNTDQSENSANSPDQSTEDKKKKGLPEVSVELFGKPDSVTVNSQDDPSKFKWIYINENELIHKISPRKPHIINVELPSGTNIEQYSKITFISFNKKQNMFGYVKISPFNTAMKFPEAFKKTREILEKWEWVPDERTKKEMKEWKRIGGGRVLSGYKGRGKIAGEEKVEVSFQIKYNNPSEKWYLSILIYPIHNILYDDLGEEQDSKKK